MPSVLDLSHMDTPPLLRSACRIRPALLACGSARSDFVSSPPVPHIVSLSVSLPFRSFARLKSALLVLGEVHIRSSFSSKSLARLSPAVSVASIARLDLLLLVLDFPHFRLPLPLQNSAHSGFVPATCDLTYVGSSPPLRSSARSGLILFRKR